MDGDIHSNDGNAMVDNDSLVPNLNFLVNVPQTKWEKVVGEGILEWIKAKHEIDQIFQINFATISYFMDNACFSSSKEKKQYFNLLYQICSTAAASAWYFGKVCAEESGLLNEIPEKFKKILDEITDSVYFLFKIIFISYYDSEFTSVPQQKNAHLADTKRGLYQIINNCFLKSRKNYSR